MNKSIKTIFFILLVGLSTPVLCQWIQYKDAITTLKKNIQSATTTAQENALSELSELAKSVDSRVKWDASAKLIYIEKSAIDAITTKYTSSETKTKAETGKSTASSSSASCSSSSSTVSSETKSKTERCAFGDCLAVPQDLQNKNIYYLKITQQQTMACGYHSVANAWAIQNLLKNDAVITAKAIDLEKGQMAGTKAITDATILEMCNELGVKNAYVMGYSPRIHFIGSSDLTQVSFDECFAALKTNTMKHAFFICHTGGYHWFLIAVLKNGSTTNILCLDSLNTPMNTKNDARYNWLKYIYDNVTPKTTVTKPDTSQDEALARALAESTAVTKPNTSEDEALARALAESLK